MIILKYDGNRVKNLGEYKLDGGDDEKAFIQVCHDTYATHAYYIFEKSQCPPWLLSTDKDWKIPKLGENLTVEQFMARHKVFTEAQKAMQKLYISRKIP